MQGSREEHEVQPHDPGARRQAILLFVVVAAIGGVAILRLEPYLESITGLADTDPREALRQLAFVTKVMTVAIIVPMFAFVAWLLVLARRVHRAERFPPPGMALTRDTRILRGRAARVRAWSIAVLALALAASSIVLPVFMWRTIHLLQDKILRIRPPLEAPARGAARVCGTRQDRHPR
jgi:hypothetical protein